MVCSNVYYGWVNLDIMSRPKIPQFSIHTSGAVDYCAFGQTMGVNGEVRGCVVNTWIEVCHCPHLSSHKTRGVVPLSHRGSPDVLFESEQSVNTVV